MISRSRDLEDSPADLHKNLKLHNLEEFSIVFAIICFGTDLLSFSK